MSRIDSIEQFFRDHEGREVTTLEITQATGTLAPSTKVSQLRDRGMDIRKTRDEWRKDGTRICGYTFYPTRAAAATDLELFPTSKDHHE